jgi:YidC/Oxa1 family membrane protein insertase
VEGSKSHRLNSALFEWSEETDAGLPALRFRHRSERGAAEKVFRLTPDDLIEVEVTVTETPDWGLVFGPGIRKLEAGSENDRFVQRMAAFRRTDGESDHFEPRKVHEDILVPGGGLSWVSLEDNFFLTAVVPRRGLDGVRIRPVLERAEVRPGEPRFLPIGTEVDEGANQELLLLLEARGERMEILTFFGAKQYRRLTSLGHHLEETVRWGKFIGIFARPLYYALEWIHGHMVANYGWAIVLVTVLIRLLFFPLTYKSQDSMAKMQELNPKIQAIKNKYRGKLKDRQGRPNVEAHRAMQQEQTELFRQAGVNPAASCLPLILQMPVFFAFFRLLSTAVELRGAPWLAWIQDLSTKDPYYILPLVMGATSVAMQRMMPSAADPVQRRVIQMMPIMFTIFALAFPSGLVLYWVTNNLLSMLQQWLMLRLKGKKPASGRQEAKSET